MLSAKETLQKEPLVKKDGLKGGGYYVEYRTDDARLTIEVMKEAVKFGAEPVNYSKVKELLYEKGKVVGVLIEDLLSGKEYKVYAKKIVNATGPWVDELREKTTAKAENISSTQKGSISYSTNPYSRLNRRCTLIRRTAGWCSPFRVKEKHTWVRPIRFTNKNLSTRA